MDTHSNYTYMMNLVAAATADGMTALAAVYAEMATELLAQYEAEQRIEKAAAKYADEMTANGRDLLEGFEMDRYGITRLGKERRFEAAMAKSNLYLAIRNAVYFEEAS